MILMASCAFTIDAKDNELMIKLRTGHNATFGGFAAFSLETLVNFDNDFQINGGAQYNTIGRTAIEARPSYLIECPWGRISAETLLLYRNLTSLNSAAVGAGADISFRWLAVKFGYYYHMYG